MECHADNDYDNGLSPRDVLRFACDVQPVVWGIVTWQDRLTKEIISWQKLPPKLRWKGLLMDMSNVSNIDSTACQLLGMFVKFALWIDLVDRSPWQVVVSMSVCNCVHG